MVFPSDFPTKPNIEPHNLLLIKNASPEPPKKEVTLQEFLDASEKFPIPFPVETGRCKFLKEHNVDEKILERNINSAYPLIHEQILELYTDFLHMKREYGSPVEKSLYKSMSLMDFVNRLLKNRAVTFVGRADGYLLLDGTEGHGNWGSIGTKDEKPPLVLKDYLSYDEVKLSAFLYVSSFTYFVNDGKRRNMAKYCDKRGGIEDEGIIMGLIGPRLKKANVMEYQEIVINPKQNTTSNGYVKIKDGKPTNIHQLFSKFYKENCLDYKSLQPMLSANSDRFRPIDFGNIFDDHLYYKRLAVAFDVMLIEANQRAKEMETFAFLHVVGLGLGVWRIDAHQDQVFMDIFADRIKTLDRCLSSISDICFSYIDQPHCGNVKNGGTFEIASHPRKGIKIHIYKREPHTRLVNESKEHEGKLLCVSYAWDGNALPGNEFWEKHLAGSGDSAAASSTQIAELHNPHINFKNVCADNLRIATRDGVVTFKDYKKEIESLVS